MRKEEKQPCFSVIIPVYNRPVFVRKAISSVLNQSFEDFELIVVDDGSIDGTSDSVKSFRDSRVEYIYQENSGVSRARNRGISESRGRLIAFLDSDDWWLKEKLKVCFEIIEKQFKYRVFHTQEKWYRGGKVLNQKKKHRKPHGNVFKRCLRLCCISMSTAVLRREVFDDFGFFDESLPACEDYDFWLRVSAKNPVFLIDEVLTEKEGGHRDQQSKRYAGMDTFRIKAIKKIIDSGELEKKQPAQALEELERKVEIYVNGCLKRGKRREAQKYMGMLQSCRDKVRK